MSNAAALPNPTDKSQTYKPALTRVKKAEEEVKERPLDFALIRRLFEFTRPHARKRNWLLFTVLLRSFQLPILAWFTGYIINGPITNRDPVGLAWSTAAFLGFAAFTQFVFYFRFRLSLELGDSVVHDLRNALFTHLQNMPMSFFHGTKVGRIISRFTSDANEIRTGVQDVLFVSLVGLGQMIVAAVMMFWLDPFLFMVIMAMGPLLWFINNYFREKLSIAYREVAESFSRVTGTLAESINGMRVTQSFVRQDVNSGLFRELVSEHAGHTMHAEKTSGLFHPLIDFNSQAFVAALLVIGGYRVLSPDVNASPGNLISFFFLTSQFFSPIQILGNMYNAALTSMAGAERVFALLDSKPAWVDPPNAIPLGRARGKVEFQNVSFEYEPGRPVLHEINFVAEPGQTIALVGHTGSGKSTIVNLISKFYLPGSGMVKIDGHDLYEVQTQSWRKQLGIVLQQNFLFTGSVLENIRLGRPTATDAEVREALAKLDCTDLIEALPEGLATKVGERGVGVSLGQRQLICFARAMLADPRVIILDEATSSVDALTEMRVQHALAKLIAGRTSFIVAHRLSTIRHADQVLVLEEGRIIERGTHLSLKNSGGIYSRLYEHFTRAGEA